VKRTPSRPNTLKHLPFFEVLANVPEGSPEAKLATAGLLTLRMIDHWVLAGPPIVEPESVSVRSVRSAIMALPAKEPVRESLLTIVNTMQMLRHVDLIPVLPRVFAYAQLLERHHGATALAGDTYESVIRLGDAELDAVLVMDAHQRLAFCQRNVGALDAAHATSTALVRLAARHKDRARGYRGRIGLGLVSMFRADFQAAESIFNAVAVEAKKHGSMTEFALATHNRGVVAFRSKRASDAVALSHQALLHTTDPVDRDRILGDLAAFLINLGQFEAAIDALRILELTAVSHEPKEMAKANLLIVAVRTGNRGLFESARVALRDAQLSVDAQISVLIETAKGVELFATNESASDLLDEAERLAETHSVRSSVAEIAQCRREGASAIRSALGQQTLQNSAASEVARDLRRMANAVVPATSA
jgi:hypothetical protein